MAGRVAGSRTRRGAHGGAAKVVPRVHGGPGLQQQLHRLSEALGAGQHQCGAPVCRAGAAPELQRWAAQPGAGMGAIHGPMGSCPQAAERIPLRAQAARPADPTAHRSLRCPHQSPAPGKSAAGSCRRGWRRTETPARQVNDAHSSVQGQCHTSKDRRCSTSGTACACPTPTQKLQPTLPQAAFPFPARKDELAAAPMVKGIKESLRAPKQLLLP